VASTNQFPTSFPIPASALYADASHPLTQGYHLLADRLFDDATFRKWLPRNDSERVSSEKALEQGVSTRKAKRVTKLRNQRQCAPSSPN